MPYRIAKTLEIESGHLLTKHPGPCRFPHGHSRRVELVVCADQLNANDMVCDFKLLKQLLHDILVTWDHAFCLNTTDPDYPRLRQLYGERIIPFPERDPTSEVMARVIHDEITRRLSQHFPDSSTAPRLESVRVTETSSSWAEYRPD